MSFKRMVVINEWSLEDSTSSRRFGEVSFSERYDEDSFGRRDEEASSNRIFENS